MTHLKCIGKFYLGTKSFKLHTVWTVNDVLVDPYPFVFWSIRTLFTALKRYGSTKTKKGYGLTKTSLTVHAVILEQNLKI